MVVFKVLYVYFACLIMVTGGLRAIYNPLLNCKIINVSRLEDGAKGTIMELGASGSAKKINSVLYCHLGMRPSFLCWLTERQ